MSIFNIVLSSMLGLFLLAAGLVITFLIYQRNMIARGLKEQQLEYSYQKKLLQAVIDGQEAERIRIAHDLHDEIGSLLATSRLYFNQLDDEKNGNQRDVMNNKINMLFERMMANIRRISHDLRPVVLENLGLVSAIEGLSDRLNQSGVKFIFRHTLKAQLPQHVEVILYRVIQELISNTVKHAKASSITVTLEQHDAEILLTYQDDGIGFSISECQTGLGLKGIESRLSLIGASLNIVRPERGICFAVRWNSDKTVLQL